MPVYKVTAPDGHVYSINGPEGVPENALLAYATKMHEERLATIKENTSGSDFIRGIKSYGPQTQGLYGGVKTILGKAIGSEDLTKSGIRSINESNAAQDLVSKPSDTFSEAWKSGIGTVLTDYLPYQAGAGVSNILETLAVSTAGAAVGSLGGPGGTVAGALGGALEKTLIKKGIKEASEAIIKEQGKDAGKAFIESEAKKVLPEALASVYGKAGAKAYGSNLGVGTQAVAHGLGETTSRAVQEAENRGENPEDLDLSRLMPAAGVHAVSDYVASKIGLRALAGKYSKGTDSLLKDIGRGMAITGTLEVPPELVQTAAERYAADLPLADKKALQEYLDTAAASYAMSVVPGGVGGASAHGQAKQQAAVAAAAQQAAAAQAQRRATGTMDQQPLFTPQEAPIPEPTLDIPDVEEPVTAPISTVAPAPTTTPPTFGFDDEGKFVNEAPTEVSPDQGDLFTRKGTPTKDALASVEAARLQGLPAQIQELLQSPEGRAELAGNMKMYFPDLDVKERNKTRQAIQQGTYGVEPTVAPEGTLTPDILKTFGITPRSKQFKALNGGNLADPTTYNLLTVAAATNTDFGVKANRILEAFPQYNPNAAQPDSFGVPNAPQTKPQAEPSQPDLFGVQPNGVPDTTQQQGTEQGVGVPVQPTKAKAQKTSKPVGPGVVGDSGVPQSDVGGAGPSTAGQPSALGPIPTGEAKKAAAALKKMPLDKLWADFETGVVFGKLSKTGKDQVRDAVAGNFLTQDLADQIATIEKGNARGTAASKAIKVETPLDDTITTSASSPRMPDIETPATIEDEVADVAKGLTGKNPVQAANWLAQNIPDKGRRLIAAAVADRLEQFKKIGFDMELIITKQGGKGDYAPTMIGNRGSMGQRSGDPTRPFVILNGTMDGAENSGLNYRTALHELTHMATRAAISYAWRNNTNEYKRLKAVREHVKDYLKAKDNRGEALNEFELYALKRYNNSLADEDEIVAWAFGSKEMQAMLESIPYTSKESAWSTFVNIVRDLMGLSADSQTALSEVISTSENLMNYKISPDFVKGQSNKIFSEQKAQTETPAFKKWFGDSKVVDKQGNPLVIYRGTYTNNEGALNAEAREGYAAFGSDNPYISNTYANPDATFGGEGSVLPLYIKADKLIEFPVTVSRFDPNLRMFDKFEFDRRAQRLQPGEVLVARQVNDTGPRANLSFDPERKFAKYSDIYAWNKGTSVKSAVGNKGTFDATNDSIIYEIDPQAQAQAQQFIAGMSGTLARSVPTQTVTPAQAAQNFVATVYNKPTDALGMIESMANRIRTGAIDKAAHLSASIQDHNDGAFYDVNGQMRADLKLSAANNNNNYINSVFTFGDIDILPNGAIQVKQGKHSVDNIFRQAKTLADRIGVEQMRKLVTDSFYHYRAKAIIDNVSPDKWPENWQKDPRMVPTTAQINAAMAAFNQFPELRAMQREFIGSKNQMVKFLQKAGFLSAEKAKAFLADDSYAPWLRLKEYQDTIPGLGNVGKMVDLSQMKALVGGTEEVNDMLENMSQMIGWCVRSGISNHTANSALETMATMGTATRSASRPTSGNPAHVVMTYTDGKPTFWTVENPYDLAAFQSVKGLNSPVMRAIGKGLGTLRAGIVLFPAFPLRQVVMDSQRAFVEAGVKNPWSMVGKIYKSFLSGEAFRGEHQDIQTLMQYGVVGGADFTAMDTTRGRATQFGIGEEAKTITDKWVRSPAYNFLHKLAYSADLAVRLGIYRQTLEETGDETLAATKAREIINFQKSGTSELMHTLKQTIPFLGAYLQGMDVNYRGMVGRGNSMQSRKAAAKAYWGNMAMYAGLTIAYTMAMSGDDDYEEQKGYVTDHNFLIPGGGLLPIPPDVGFLAKVVPERITDYILQEGTDSPESARRLRQGLLQSFAAGYMPPAAVYGVTPAIELMLNKSFFSDMPIVSQRMQGRDPKFQYTASTSEIAKEIGDITGQSPLQIDYLFNAIGGTSAGALLQLTDVAFGSGKMAPDKTPIISSFQQKTVGGRNAEEYYALREMADRAYNTVQALAMEQNPEKLQEYLADPKKQQLYAMHQGIESLHAQLNQVSRVRNIIEKDPNLSPEEKRQKVNELLANVEATLRAMPIRKQRAELE